MADPTWNDIPESMQALLVECDCGPAKIAAVEAASEKSCRVRLSACSVKATAQVVEVTTSGSGSLLPAFDEVEIDLVAALAAPATQAEKDAITAWAQSKGIALATLAERCTVAIARLRKLIT